MDYTLENITPEEQALLTKEIEVILDKYNCEMGVETNIRIWKRKEKANDNTNDHTEEDIDEV